MPPKPVPRVTLQSRTTDEWVPWYAAQRADYVEQMVLLDGISRDDAEAKADHDYARLLALGQATPQHHFSVARSEGKRVEALWLAEPPSRRGTPSNRRSVRPSGQAPGTSSDRACSPTDKDTARVCFPAHTAATERTGPGGCRGRVLIRQRGGQTTVAVRGSPSWCFWMY